MKKWLLLCLLIANVVLSQTPPTKPVDSSVYYIELAQFNAKISNYLQSLHHTRKAIDFAKKHKDVQGEAKASLALGMLYIDIKKYDEAIQILNRSLTLFNTLSPSADQAFAYYNLGLCYMEKENYAGAEAVFDKANTIYQTLKIPDAMALLDLQKGIAYKAKGRTQQAMQLFSAIAAMPKEKDIYSLRPEALHQMGVIEIEMNRNNLALNYLQRALKLSSDPKHQELRSRIYKSTSEAYDRISNVKRSYEYLKRHLALQDSISSVNKEKLGADDYASFKEADRLKMIEQLDKENLQQQRQAKIGRLITILAIALITILSLLSLSLYKNNIIRNQSNKLLEEKNRELQLAKDRAEKASKARSEFLSTVSHELRTPLNAINGITHLLLEEDPKKSQLKYLNSLKFSGNYLLTFINEILEINRIESSTVVAEKINFNLKLLLGNIQNSLREMAVKNGNKFSMSIDENIPDLLIGDPTKLSQIFMNLINNALKFTKDGEVRVVAVQEEVVDDVVRIRFEVMDTGIGIPEDKHEAVFDSFSQGSIEINRKYGGTGLGLNIVKKLVAILGGKISLRSKVGQGSTFSFHLDFKISAGQTLSQNDHYDEEVFVNKKVLLIEDNKINQMITSKMLENKQMLVEIIDNGEDAIEAVKNNYYDLVLMDVHLPGINGTIATQTIRTFDQHTRIIALTAISLNENREMLLSYGMNDVITKPFDPNDFYRIIAQHIQ